MTQMIDNRVALSGLAGSPFSLDEAEAYQSWRQQKLEQRPVIEELVVAVENPFELTAMEKSRIQGLCRRCNAAIYKVSDEHPAIDKRLVHQLGLQFGLTHLDDNLRSDEDDITSLTVIEQQGNLSLIHISEPTRQPATSRIPSSA